MGALLGLFAYGFWGLLPLYYHLFNDDVSALELVANRIIWATVFLLLLTSVTRTWKRTISTARSVRNLAMLSAAAVLLGVNWSVYMYAIESNQLVEGSLGYFINPLLSVGLGVIVLRERLRSGQWIAVGVAGLAVLVLTVSFGRPPWISLLLAGTFAVYGLVKKQLGVGAVQSLTVETAILAPVAVVALVGMSVATTSSAIDHTPLTLILLIGLGPTTALPLLAFTGAATRIPLSTLGLMQYLCPVMLFLLGVLVFGEQMSTSRWIGFVLVWISLSIMTIDSLRHARRGRNVADDLEVTVPD